MSQQIDMDAVIEELRKGWRKGDVGPIQKDAGAVCLMGAFYRTTRSANGDLTQPQPFIRLVLPIIDEQFPGRSLDHDFEDLRTIPAFNDHPDTTLDDVIAVVEKARAAQGECHE